jgi:hypothetical protein
MNTATALGPYKPFPGKRNVSKRQGEGLCKLAAGSKTDHLGYGHCYRHSGAGLIDLLPGLAFLSVTVSVATSGTDPCGARGGGCERRD